MVCCKGRAERIQWGPLDSIYILYVIGDWGSKIELQKHEWGSAFLETSKTFNFWMGGWVVIKRVLQFSSFSSVLTSKIRWFQIWPQKLSTAIRSKVMSNLILKFWNFEADFRGGKWPKIMMVTNDLSSRRKLRKVKKKNCRKNAILGSKISKNLKVQKWPQKSSTSS